MCLISVHLLWHLVKPVSVHRLIYSTLESLCFSLYTWLWTRDKIFSKKQLNVQKVWVFFVVFFLTAAISCSPSAANYIYIHFTHFPAGTHTQTQMYLITSLTHRVWLSLRTEILYQRHPSTWRLGRAAETKPRSVVQIMSLSLNPHPYMLCAQSGTWFSEKGNLGSIAHSWS